MTGKLLTNAMWEAIEDLILEYEPSRLAGRPIVGRNPSTLPPPRRRRQLQPNPQFRVLCVNSKFATFTFTPHPPSSLLCPRIQVCP